MVALSGLYKELSILQRITFCKVPPAATALTSLPVSIPGSHLPTPWPTSRCSSSAWCFSPAWPAPTLRERDPEVCKLYRQQATAGGSGRVHQPLASACGVPHHLAFLPSPAPPAAAAPAGRKLSAVAAANAAAQAASFGGGTAFASAAAQALAVGERPLAGGMGAPESWALQLVGACQEGVPCALQRQQV